ncbi:tape measure protein, partial [Klebsiella pneumoniae]
MECNPIPKDPASELLSGEDFSRLNETAPRLIRALAERAGTSVANLRKMA